MKDYAGQILKIVAAKPDGIEVWGLYQESALIAKQLRQLGYDGVILGCSGKAHANYRRLGGEATNKTAYAAPWSIKSKDPVMVEFIKRFEAKHGVPPQNDGAFRAYDAASIILRAMENAKSFDPARIRDAIADMKNFAGLGGTFTFNGGTGEGLDRLKTILLLNGEEHVLSEARVDQLADSIKLPEGI